MAEIVLIKGNEAAGKAAIMAGCTHYYGYPITPQNEIPEYMSLHLPEAGGTFIQAESETSSINMMFGSAAAGMRTMTSTSGPGYSLMLEGLSHFAAAELPCVLVLVSRGGPGGGSLESTQLDYFSVTKGGAHGGYRNIVLAPMDVQEFFDHTQMAFDLADKYRMVAVVLTEATLGNMAKPIEIKRVHAVPSEELPAKDWVMRGKAGKKKKLIVGGAAPGFGSFNDLNELNRHLADKYRTVALNETRYEAIEIEEADVVVVAFGITAGGVKQSLIQLNQEGYRAGMIRPITLFPFPTEIIRKTSERVKKFLVVEGNMGQMVEDVQFAVGDKAEVSFLGKAEGLISLEEIYSAIRSLCEKG